PSANSVSVDVLARLFQITKETGYQSRAERTLAAFGSQIEQSPSGFTRMLLGAGPILQPAQELAQAPAEKPRVVAKEPPRTTPPGNAEKLDLFTQPTEAEAAKHQYVKGRIYLSTSQLTPGVTTKVACVLDIAEG